MTPDKVKERIKLLGLKKSHVAERIGVSPTQLSHYLNNRRDLEINAKTRLKLYLDL